jgi:hypothetical protein
MKHLPDPVLEKAIEIANALLEEGMDEREGYSHRHRESQGMGRAPWHRHIG